MSGHITLAKQGLYEFDRRNWEEAVTKFAKKIPDLAKGVTTFSKASSKQNAAFRENCNPSPNSAALPQPCCTDHST